MGLPTREVNFNGEQRKPSQYVSWDNILYRPELFPPAEHRHPEIESILEEYVGNAMQVVDSIPGDVKKGQFYFIRKR